MAASRRNNISDGGTFCALTNDAWQLDDVNVVSPWHWQKWRESLKVGDSRKRRPYAAGTDRVDAILKRTMARRGGDKLWRASSVA